MRRRDQREVVLAIDQGTTQTKAMLVDARLRVLGEAALEIPQHYPRPGWVEHDGEEILRSVRGAVKAALRKGRVGPGRIAAIGITNQRETTLVWDARSGKPLHRAIVWQDRRTAPRCEALKQRGLEPEVRSRTGLVLDAYFSGTKLAWILDHVGNARAKGARGEVLFGTVDSFLIHRLTGGRIHATDVSNASRTLLWNLRGGYWDEQMLRLFRIPARVLPEVRPNDAVLGETRGLGFLPDGIPISGPIGDQQSALFGQACFSPGEAKCTYGTGAFLLVNTGHRPARSRSGLLSTAAWKLGTKTTYALEGSVFIAGAAVQWLRDGLRLISHSPEVEALARSVPDSGGVALVPALTGLGAPHWRPGARGIITGITRGTNAGHIARAALEGIAFQCHDVLRAMERDTRRRLRAVKVDGGAAANDLLMQFQADIIGREIIRPRFTNTTALGAALLAGLATGVFTSLAEIRGSFEEERRFRPRLPRNAVEEHLSRWREALAKA